VGAHRDDERIAAHIASVSSRADADADRLIAALLGHCWPGGHCDRSEHVALEWVRRWRPRPIAALATACDCASGRCSVCN